MLQVEVEIHPDNNGISSNDGSAVTQTVAAGSYDGAGRTVPAWGDRGWKFLSWMSLGRPNVSRDGGRVVLEGADKGARSREDTLSEEIVLPEFKNAKDANALLDPLDKEQIKPPPQQNPPPDYQDSNAVYQNTSATTPLQGSLYEQHIDYGSTSVVGAKPRSDSHGIFKASHSGRNWQVIGAGVGALASAFALCISLVGSICVREPHACSVRPEKCGCSHHMTVHSLEQQPPAVS